MKIEIYIRLWICIVLVSFILTGCWDRREVNDIAFVLSTGIDKEESGYRITVQIPLPGQMGEIGSTGGGGGTSGNKSWYLESSIGDTVKDANNKQQKSLSRSLYFAHRRVVLIGEEMSKAGIIPLLDILVRIPQNRTDSFVAVTKGSAQKFLNVQSPIEKYPAELMRELIQQRFKKPIVLRDIVDILLSDGIDLALPIVVPSKIEPLIQGDIKSTLELDGVALFHEDKMIGIIEGDSASALLWSMDKLRYPNMIIKVPKGSGMVALHFSQYSIKWKPRVENKRIVMALEIRASGTIVENKSNLSVANAENIRMIEEEASKILEKNIKNTINTLQDTYHSDPIGFGDMIYREMPEVWDSIKAEWDEYYPRVSVEVTPLLHLDHSGSVLEPVGRKDKEIVR